jgi:hypothetical protein
MLQLVPQDPASATEEVEDYLLIQHVAEQEQQSNVNNITHHEDFTFFHLNLFCLGSKALFSAA